LLLILHGEDEGDGDGDVERRRRRWQGRTSSNLKADVVYFAF